MGQKIGKLPHYNTVKTEGAPHMRTFSISCTLDNYTCIGEGKSKKDAKLEAAVKVLNEVNRKWN